MFYLIDFATDFGHLPLNFVVEVCLVFVIVFDHVICGSLNLFVCRLYLTPNQWFNWVFLNLETFFGEGFYGIYYSLPIVTFNIAFVLGNNQQQVKGFEQVEEVESLQAFAIKLNSCFVFENFWFWHHIFITLRNDGD